MRRNRLLLLLAAAVVSTAACRMMPLTENGPARVSVSFEAAAPGTRAAFTEPEGDLYPVVWQGGDRVKLFLNGSEVNPDSDRGVMTAQLSEGGKTAHFEIALPDPGALESFNYCVLSPAASFSALDGNPRMLTLSIPSSQQSAALSPDPSAMLLWASSGPYGGIHDPVKLAFRHLTAYGKLSLTGLKGTLHAVELVSDRDLAGGFRFPSQTSPQVWDDVLTPATPVRRLQLAATDPDAVWFACAPVDWSGSILQVTATTSEGTFARTVTFPDGREMKPGQIARFRVDMAEASGKTDVFDEAHIVFSFGAISDTHVSGTTHDSGNKLASALRQLKARALEHDADGLDAVVVAGDLTDHPGSARAETGYFKTLYEAALDPAQVPMIYTIGNHDVNPGYAWTGSTVSQAKAMSETLGSSYFLYDQDQQMRENFECRDCLVDGYHVLSVTPNSDQPIGFHGNVIFWLDARLKELTEADPERFVFVNTHPMIENTVYGSLLGAPSAMDEIWQSTHTDYWATRALTETLSKYPQAVTFGGHLHFPLHDPRSIWQGAFTSFGCGSVYYMAIENGKYEDMSSATVMNDSYSVSDGWLVQLDRNGNLRATALDFSNQAVIGVPYEVPYPHADRSHLTRYDAGRATRNQAPVLDPSALLLTSRQIGTVTSTVVEWAKGADDAFVHHYVLQVSQNGTPILTKKYLTDFYRHPLPSGMKDKWTVPVGNLPAGTYTVSLTAYDSWDASTNCTKSFTIEGPEPMEPGLYADIDFDGGVAHDVRGKVAVSNRGAVIAPVSVTHAGQTSTVPAMQAGVGKYVECQFSEIATTTEMAAFMNQGFSIETMFVDKAPGTEAGADEIHGVFCGTESGGWGLAMRKTAVPYFIVGEGSGSNSYRSLDATSRISSSELTHVVCTYDTAGKQMKLYLNGVLNGSLAISGVYHNGAGTAFNRFCLGADIKNGSGADFRCSDMVISDAKFYVGALDAAAVQAAYQTAVNELKK